MLLHCSPVRNGKCRKKTLLQQFRGFHGGFLETDNQAKAENGHETAAYTLASMKSTE